MQQSTPIHDDSKQSTKLREAAGKTRTWLLLWLLGIPLPIILIIVLLRGC